jgi:hypothetical protein
MALAGVCASMAAWTKNEGCFTGWPCSWRSSLSAARRGEAGCARPLQWFWGRCPACSCWSASSGLRPGNDLLEGASLGAIARKLSDPSRYVLVGEMAWSMIFGDAVGWSRLPLILPVLLMMGLVLLGHRAAARLGLAVLLTTGGFGLVYLTTPHGFAGTSTHRSIASSRRRGRRLCWPPYSQPRRAHGLHKGRPGITPPTSSTPLPPGA